MAEKLEKVRSHGHLKRAYVQSLTDYFWVPKTVALEQINGALTEVVTDVRMACNGTSSGLNEALWAPNFFLPTADLVLRCVVEHSVSVDLDLGDFFLNTFVDPKIRPHAGIDLTPVVDQLPSLEPKPEGPHCERWERCFVGCKPSPCNAIRTHYWAEEFARGDPMDPDNPMGFDEVILNLAGDPKCKPHLPNVMKWNSMVERTAGDLKTFVDDLHAIGYSEENTWQAAWQMVSRLQCRGIQNAPRKCRPPSQAETGAWVGGVLRVLDNKVTKTMAQEKWDKGWAIIRELLKPCAANQNALPDFIFKDMERKQGFLVHLAMTHPFLIPFLKGIHLTLDSWRPNRKDDGWAMSSKEWACWLQCQAERLGVDPGEVSVQMLGLTAPKTVKAVPRLWSDLCAMDRMFEQESPTMVSVRSRKMHLAVHGFGDASGKGVGSSVMPATRGLQDSVQDDNGIIYRIGVWFGDDEANTSNWKELTNVVDSIEDLCTKGQLKNAELFFCTDNSVTEAAMHKGTSTSPKLLEQVICLRVLEAWCGFVLHVIHVSGRRMIAQGTDGISRGLLVEGVMAGKSVLSFLPLHLSAPERAQGLEGWIKSWAGHPEAELLAPCEWFQKGHDVQGWQATFDRLLKEPVLKRGTWIWAPPPAAAVVATEEL